MLKSGRIALLLVLLLSHFLTIPTPSFACSCAESFPPELAAGEAAAVFAGHVTHIPSPPAGGVISSADLIPITFEVTQVWKGPADPVLTVRTERNDSSCGYSFREGEAYIVYARLSNGLLRTGACTRTALLADATEDLAALGRGETPQNEPPAPAAEEATLSLPIWVWGIAGILGALLLLSIPVLVAWRSRRVEE
ncbi:MAG: hypothetical protein ACRDIB_14645 [Ardenticatenaceae bacterium]